MGTVPTVKVVSGDGFVVINESDFDPEVHEPYEGDAAGPAETHGIRFASAAAEDAADQAGLEEGDFDGEEPSGQTGFTKADVERIAAAKGAGAEG